MKKTSPTETRPASELIDDRIAELADWRGETLRRMRQLIHEVDPDVVEEWKWMGTPVWSHDGIICTGESYKAVVKLTFAKGAALNDPAKLFNASLDGNARRAIDIREGDVIDATAFKALVHAAIALNSSKTKTKPASKKSGGAAIEKSKPVKLLAGGNPQIAKADGDTPVQVYIDAVPDWKREVVRRLDALVVQNVPGVKKAVKWNSPFYGIEGQGWFLSLHVFTRYVKVTFFKGTSLKPAPAGGTAEQARWIDVHEHDLDEAQIVAWIRQAAALPGWLP